MGIKERLRRLEAALPEAVEPRVEAEARRISAELELPYEEVLGWPQEMGRGFGATVDDCARGLAAELGLPLKTVRAWADL